MSELELDKKKVLKDLQSWANILAKLDEQIRSLYSQIQEVHKKVLEMKE